MMATLTERYAHRHPSIVGVLRFLTYEHLPKLRTLSANFAALASTLIDQLPDDPELVIALRKLREAKDCAVGLAAVGPRPEDGP